MDPLSLTLGGVVVGLLVKAVDVAGDRAISAGERSLKRVADSVRTRFSGTGDTDAVSALKELERMPEDASSLMAVADAVNRHSSDPAFRSDLERLVAELAESGIDSGKIAQSVWGNQNVQLSGVADSVVKITYGGQPEPRRPD